MKKLYLLAFLLSCFHLAFSQSGTLNFNNATGTYGAGSPTQSIANGSDTWIFTVTGTNATSYQIDYGDSHGNYLEVTTQGTASVGVAKLSIKKSSAGIFDFTSLYLYAVGSRQQFKIIGLRTGTPVAGYSINYDLGPFSTPGLPDATVSVNWRSIDEVQIINIAASSENGAGYQNDLAIDLDDFTYAASSTLPLSWVNFTATAERNNIRLNWQTALEQNTKNFTVQHSTDGITWENIGTLPAARNSSTTQSYTFQHSNPSNGHNEYRILETDMDGRSSYSKVVDIAWKAGGFGLVVYPNPAAGGKINIQLATATTVQVFNATGSLVLEKYMSAGTQAVDLGELAHGLYTIKANKESSTILVP